MRDDVEAEEGAGDQRADPGGAEDDAGSDGQPVLLHQTEGGHRDGHARHGIGHRQGHEDRAGEEEQEEADDPLGAPAGDEAETRADDGLDPAEPFAAAFGHLGQAFPVDLAGGKARWQPGLFPADHHLEGQRQHRQGDNLRHAIQERNAAGQRQQEKARAKGALVQPVKDFPQREALLRRGLRQEFDRLQQGALCIGGDGRGHGGFQYSREIDISLPSAAGV